MTPLEMRGPSQHKFGEQPDFLWFLFFASMMEGQVDVQNFLRARKTVTPRRRLKF